MPTAVFADALYDPATAETVRAATILIDGGRVQAAGPRGQVREYGISPTRVTHPVYLPDV